jgi:hypothetical protein
VRAAVVALAVLAFVPAATAGTTVPNPLTTPSAVAPSKPHLPQQEAIARFLADPKVKAWLERYPPKPTTDATFKDGSWTVNVWSGRAGEIATGLVDDQSGTVTEAWTGPQVAWKMARGSPGAFGGDKINSTPVWLAFCAVFLLGLADWRRPLSVRNADLLVLVSLSASLWFFNHGNIFAAVPLVYPPLVWLLVRCVWVARGDRPVRGGAVWPVWLLAAATVFLAGFRIGLNVRASNVIDVGYSGVIGADRIVHGESPYGHFPVEDARPNCGPADADGEVRDHIQTNGRCESANPLGDTYGPVSYLAYIPGYLLLGWSHKWDTLPAVHATSILFDLLALVGLALVGRKLGGPRLGATLAFAWAAVAVSGWTKFASLLLLPLWSGYPEARRPRNAVLTLLGFALATVVVFFVLFLEPSPAHAARVFFDRTVRFQIGRDSPFSLWDWRQYRASGLPDLHLLQRGLQAVLVAGALALGWWPRHRSPLRMAALTGAVLVGFELVLTHWSYLYLPWFFPFVAMALVGQLPGRAVVEQEVHHHVEQPAELLPV